MADEEPDFSDAYQFVDPKQPWKNMKFRNVDAKPLQVTIFENGKLVYDKPTLKEIQAFVKKHNPHIHYLDLSQKLYDVKKELLSGVEYVD